MAPVLACSGKEISIKMMKLQQQEGENDLTYLATVQLTWLMGYNKHGHCVIQQSEMSQHLPRGLEEQVLSMQWRKMKRRRVSIN